MESRRLAIARIVVYAAVGISILLVLAITGNIPSSEEARDFGDDLGPLAPILFVPLFVLANFLIAWPILVGAGGLLFGTAAGTVLGLAGVTCAALAQMAVARWLAGEHRGRLLPRRTKRIENFLTDHGAVAVMESRIVPVLPFGIVNYSAGLVHLPYKEMAIGTIIGAAPKVFVYAALGGSIDDLGSPEAIAAISVWVVVAIGGVLFVRHQVRAAPAE